MNNRKKENIFLSRTFKWMIMALMLTLFVSVFVASTPWLANFIIGNRFVFIGILILELVFISTIIRKVMNLSLAEAYFYLMIYSILNGLTLSIIFIVFNPIIILQIFLTVIVLFIIMSIVGKTTSLNLSSIGTYLLMGLVGLILVMIINTFMNNAFIDLFISVAGIILFLVMTAYDVQKLKKHAHLYEVTSDESKKLSVIGALSLYLDVVNLFLFFLNLDKK